jgi:hypothetical protein
MARGCYGRFKKAENIKTGRKQLRTELGEDLAEKAKTQKGV